MYTVNKCYMRKSKLFLPLFLRWVDRDEGIRAARSKVNLQSNCKNTASET